MPLTTDQQEKIKNHLSNYLKLNKCPICGGNRWIIEGELSVFQLFDSQYKMIIEGQVAPVAVVTCEQCYYCLSFNAMKLGLL